MTETQVTPTDIEAITALASGIIPADARDAGAAAVNAGPSLADRMQRSPSSQVYVTGLAAANKLSQTMFAASVPSLDAAQLHALLGALREESPAFFRQLRADVCALYLSDPGVWQRIGFPGPSTNAGGYPDFDQPQD